MVRVLSIRVKKNGRPYRNAKRHVHAVYRKGDIVNATIFSNPHYMYELVTGNYYTIDVYKAHECIALANKICEVLEHE